MADSNCSIGSGRAEIAGPGRAFTGGTRMARWMPKFAMVIGAFAIWAAAQAPAAKAANEPPVVKSSAPAVSETPARTTVTTKATKAESLPPARAPAAVY